MDEIRALPKMLAYHFGGILYPDATNYDCAEVLELLNDVFACHAFVLHDMDTDENGVLKKPHYHFYGKRKCQSSCSATAKKLGIPAKDVEYVKHWRKYLRYFIHADDPDKFQYSADLVTSSWDIDSILDEATEGKRILVMIEYITSTGTKSILDLANFALNSNCWSEFRRSYSIMKDIMNEVHK